ncbi:hypothetical protein [Fodinibius sediminis]|nr:hypothetical protein [Fodinibius sediminis]
MEKPSLTVQLFTEATSDFETSQYRILAALKIISDDFQKNKIYPHLSHLVELYATLGNVLDRLQDARKKFPKRIKRIDFVNQVIEHEVVFVPGSDLTKTEDLIEWALPYIRAKIEEGRTIYEFASEEIKLQEVGIIPNYTDEGYLFVPDNERSRLLLFQYEVSVFESSTAKYRSLKTSFLKAINKGRAHRSPNAIKLNLISEHGVLPNPATYAFNTRLQFPFQETIFPITKRKLMQQLYDER